jgi:hypothetical protein
MRFGMLGGKHGVETVKPSSFCEGFVFVGLKREPSLLFAAF